LGLPAATSAASLEDNPASAVRRLSRNQWAGKREGRARTRIGFPEMAMNKKWMFVVLGYVLLLAALGVTFDGSLALIAIDRLAQSERYTDEMDKLEIYRGFEIRAFEREQGRWRAEIRKADGSTLKTLVGDSGHRMSITTPADTLTAETSIDEVKKAIDAGGMS